MMHRFGDFEVDEGLFELRRKGQQVRVEPKVFDVLAYLLNHRDRVVTREELLSTLWNAERVSDAALSSCVRDARRAVGDDGARQAAIKTIHGRGFRFVMAVQSTAEVQRASGATAAGGRIAFVGRDDALAKLRTRVERAASGQGSCILLSGEAGIGKTRTADELSAIARSHGLEVLSGRCSETPGAPAFWPWTQILRAYASTRGAQTIRTDAPPDLAAIIAAPAGALDENPRGLSETPQNRFRLFDGLTELFKKAAAGQPLVLIVDDLHQADASTLLAFEFIAREVRAARVILLGAYRDTDIDAEHLLTRIAADLSRLDWTERIELGGLSVSEVRRFLEQALGSAPPDAVVAAAYEKSAGNPFFLTEIAPLLGHVDQKKPAKGGVAVPIPRTTRDAVMRRLDALPVGSHAVLTAAAVLGREFETIVLARVIGGTIHARRLAQHRLRAALDAAERARIIEPIEHTQGRYRFTHVLIRDTLYDALVATKRRRLHAVSGFAIENVYRLNRDPHAAVLAYHFSSTADEGALRKAVQYSMRAAARASTLLAYEDAVEHYRHALDLVDGGARLARDRRARGKGASEQQRRCEILLALGDNQWKAGDRPGARDTIARAAEVARGCRSWTHLALAALAYGGGFRGFDVGVVEPALIALLEEVLRRLPAKSTALRARVLGRLAVALYHVPSSFQRRKDLTQQAVRTAVRSRDRATHIAALYSRHWGTWGPDNNQERIRTASTMVRLSAAAHDGEMELHAHRFLVIAQVERGDLREIDTQIAACERLAAQLRQPYYHWYVAVFRVGRAILRSDFHGAMRLAEDALEWGQRAQSTNVLQAYATQQFVIHRELGQLESIAPRIRALVDKYPVIAWRTALAFLYAEIGQRAEARTELDIVATHDFLDVPRDPFFTAYLMMAADTCVFLQDRRRAEVLYEVLRPFAAWNASIGLGGGPMGSLARCLGRLAALLNRPADSVTLFEGALAMHERLQARHLMAHTQREYGEALLGQGDTRRARPLLQRALATYEELGMTSFVTRVDRVLAKAS